MSTRTSLLPLLCLFAAALCSVACDDSLKSVSLIEETRVLGARVEVEGDAGRSSPGPGERASLRLFIAAPNGDPRFSYALSVCAVSLTNSGFPPCTSAPFASASRAEPTNTDAQLEFRVPEDLDLETTPHAFASGLICPDSGLKVDAAFVPSCVAGTGIEVAFEFALRSLQQSNQNPVFAVDSLSLDGEPWPASTDTSCDDSSLRRVSSRTLHALRIDLADSDFELLTQRASLDPTRETLLASPFSTAGKLGNGFIALSADTPPEQRRVSWEAPALSGSIASLVRLYFVVRDTRGGQDFAHRALCVVP